MTQGPKKRGIPKKPVNPQSIPHDAPSDPALEKRLAALHLDPETENRIRKLPKDVGWLLFSAGIMGLIVPGVIGTPFLVLGSLMIWPWSQDKAEKWLAGGSPRVFKGSMKQINRFLDDLERRYPKS